MNSDSRPVDDLTESSGTLPPKGKDDSAPRTASDDQPASRFPYRFLHHVFFRLADRTPDTFERFSQYCWMYLSEHEGLLQFDLGFRDVEMQRPVNDVQFDVS